MFCSSLEQNINLASTTIQYNTVSIQGPSYSGLNGTFGIN